MPLVKPPDITSSRPLIPVEALPDMRTEVLLPETQSHHSPVRFARDSLVSAFTEGLS